MPYTDSATGQTVLDMFLNEVEEMAAETSADEPLVCEHTGVVIEGEPFQIGVHIYASEEAAICAGWEHCEYCGGWTHYEFTNDYECIQGHTYCTADCASEDGWYICERCGEWVHCDDVVEAGDCVYCSDFCANRDGWVRCERCEEWTRDNDVYDVETYGGTETWCENCEYDYSRRCECCGELHDIDDMRYDDYSEEYYCDNCYEEHGDALHSYGYCPGIEFFGGNAWTPKPPLFMGVELETDSGHSRNGYVRELDALKDFSTHFWMTEDSSLSNGVEITGQPMTLAYHVGLRKLYEAIGETANRFNYVSHNSGNCGLHIHVNRSFFGKTELCQDAGGYKLMRLLQRFERAFTIFSRRRNAQWCSYKTSRDYKPVEKVSILKDDRPGEYNDAVKHYDALGLAHLMKMDERGHSQALNFQHRATFEFRIFRGTLKWSTYFACLGLVDGLCRTVKKHGSTWVENVTWYDLMDEVIDSCSEDYPRECLKSYLVEKGLR